MRRKNLSVKLLALAGLTIVAVAVFAGDRGGTAGITPAGTAFTYHGRLLDAGDAYTEQELTNARAAVPTMEQLQASEPQQGTMSALGEPAIFARSAYDMVIGVNGAVAGIVLGMRAITLFPPTFYNSVTKEFVWGPWENDDGHGWIAAWIKDTGEGEDFRYQYALVRGASNDLAGMTAIIWGFYNPHPTNITFGSGITLWDFEANRAFEEAHDPNFDSTKGNRGRFVALYAKGPDEENAANTISWVVAVFRNFVPEDEPGNAPADLDYLYGHYLTPSHTIDFLDFETSMDVSDPRDGIVENIGIRMAHVFGGAGRAEAIASGGSLDDDQSFNAVECWDSSFNRTFFQIAVIKDGDSVTHSWALGELCNCGDLFSYSLGEIGIPTLQDLDPEMLAALDNVAENGVQE